MGDPSVPSDSTSCIKATKKDPDFVVFFVEMFLLGRLDRGCCASLVPPVPIFSPVLSAKNKGLRRQLADGDKKEIRTAAGC